MNRNSPGLSLSKAFVGSENYKAAEGLSPNTLVNYSYHLKLLQEHVGDVLVGQVTTQDLRGFLAWLRTDYEPRRLCGGDEPLSPKTVRNFWITLSAFFRWACDEFSIPNPMVGVPAPRFEEAPVEPFTKEQVEALLKAAEHCREADTTDRRKFTMRRATGRRDRALIMVLLDTGLRCHGHKPLSV